METALSDPTTELAWAGDLVAAGKTFRTLIGQMGVELFAYVSVSAEGEVRHFDSTYPEAWINQYRNEDYLSVDPVVEEARRSSVPFAWRYLASRPMGRKQFQLFEDATKFGIRDGYTIPLRPRDGGYALISFAFPSSQRLTQVVERHPRLRQAAAYYHAAIERVMNGGQEVGEHLSAEERQSLNGIATGRSLWEIATMLCLPENNVGRLLRNARIKLGANTTAEAVRVALQRGLIAPAALERQLSH